MAAYRSGEKLKDQRYGKTRDYSDRTDVVFKEILTPQDVPAWAKDRSKLWNEVEKSENRKDAQLAREVELGLPKELTRDQQIALIKEYVQNEFADLGMCADICMHDKGDGNPHAHVMLTMREITADGLGLKNRDWNKKEMVPIWRGSWEQHVNRHCALAGLDQRIDMRSYKAQGIDLIPTVHEGNVNHKQHAELSEQNRLTKAHNGDRILNDPNIALRAITLKQATFTDADIARFARRNSDGTAQYYKVVNAIKTDPRVISAQDDLTGKVKYTTVEMIAAEYAILRHADDLDARKGHGAPLAGDSSKLSAQQVKALQHITGAGDIACVVGLAGTGKSSMLEEARETWEREGYRVRGTTLSGIAAENLEEASGIESQTIASLQWQIDHDRHLTNKDVLVVDEAGMIGTRQMARILDEAQTHGAKVVLIGDPMQLQAIEAGAAFRLVDGRTGHAELTEVWRQQQEWQKEATAQFAKGGKDNVSRALDEYDNHRNINVCGTHEDAKTKTVLAWNGARTQEPEKTQIMLAYTRADVSDLNKKARGLRQKNGELGKDDSFPTEKGTKKFAQGERIYFLRNDRELGVKNGTLGTVEKIEGDRYTVRLDKDDPQGHPRRVSFTPSQYNNIDYGYAATIHKAQGVTVDRAYVLADEHMTRNTAYVAMSRHRESAQLFYGTDKFASRDALKTTLSRKADKDLSSDYQFEKPAGMQKVAEIDPAIAKKAMDAEKYMSDMEKEIKADISPSLYRQAIERKAAELTKNKPLMEHIEHNNPELAKQVHELDKQRALENQDLKKPALEDQRKTRGTPPSMSEPHRDIPHNTVAGLKESQLEKQAQELKNKISSCEKGIKANISPSLYRQEIEKTRAEAVKNKPLMEHIEKTDKELSNKMQVLNKQHEQQHERTPEKQIEQEQSHHRGRHM
jgi:Ti-type conjugative transfer relaxase TraA